MKTIKEIERLEPISSNVNYDKFINKSAKEANKINQDKILFNGLDIQWADRKGSVKIIAYDKNEPIGYLALKPFKDGHKVYTLGVKDVARGKGVANTLYDFTISKTKLYSDSQQTPGSRKLWVKLSKKYNVKGYNDQTQKYFDVSPNEDGTEMKSDDPSNEVYIDKKNDSLENQNTYLTIIKENKNSSLYEQWQFHAYGSVNEEKELDEDFKSFKNDPVAKKINFSHDFNDPLFVDNRRNKKQARSLKTKWNEHVDRNFIQGLNKVHWIKGTSMSEPFAAKIKQFINISKSNEISTSGYKKNQRMKSTWGRIGILIDGRVTFAAKWMDEVLSGYHDPRELYSSEASSLYNKYAGKVPKRPTKSAEPKYYIFDEKSFGRQTIHGSNELIVDHWKPIGIVINFEDYWNKKEALYVLNRLRMLSKEINLPILDYFGRNIVEVGATDYTKYEPIKEQQDFEDDKTDYGQEESFYNHNTNVLSDKYADYIIDPSTDILEYIKLGKIIGKGRHGRVFDIDNFPNKAIKFFTDSGNMEKDIKRYEKTQEQMHTGKASLQDFHVFDQGQIGDGLYYVLMPKIIPLTKAPFWNMSDIFQQTADFNVTAANKYAKSPGELTLENWNRFIINKLISWNHTQEEIKRYSGTLGKIMAAGYRAFEQFGQKDIHNQNIGYLSQKPDIFFYFDM